MAKDAESERVARLTAARRAAGHQKAAQVRDAVARLERSGTPFSVSAVAREANVSRGFVYLHPDLLAAVDAARARVLAAHGRHGAGGDTAAAAELERLRAENEHLRKRE